MTDLKTFMDDNLITVAHVANVLNVTMRTVYCWRSASKENTIPTHKMRYLVRHFEEEKSCQKDG